MLNKKVTCNLCDQKPALDYVFRIETKNNVFEEYTLRLCASHLAKQFVNMSHSLLNVDLKHMLFTIGKKL